MLPRRQTQRLRFCPCLEFLESRLAPTGTTVVVPLSPILDEFGSQIVTVQAYDNSSRAAFGIFDTGASALTFSAGDQARFTALGVPIPILVPGGAVAEGLGGPIVGDVSYPGTILADGLHAANLSFNSQGQPQFNIQFTSSSAATANIQAFIGTPNGSPALPTITGMPMLDSGLAALINMGGAELNFSQVIPNLVLSLPDLTFVPSGTQLTAGPESQGPVRVPLTLVGFDNYVSPGSSVSEARVPFQNDVSLINPNYGSIQGQSFLFDTGAQVTVISTRDAQALGLDLQHPQFTGLLDGVGGSQSVGGYTIPELDLPTSDGGSVRFTNVPVFVADLGPGMDGVLGMNLFHTATAMLYDPFGPGLASVSFTFSTLGRTGAGDTPAVVAKLDHLGVSFADAIDGSQLPGFTFGTGTISGQVFLDYNGNGVADPGEPGVAGQTVFLDLHNSGQMDPDDPQTTTNANGFYQFTGVAPGTYTVREVVSSGFSTLSPSGASVTVVVSPGDTVNQVNLADLAMQPDPMSAFVAQLYGKLLDRAPDAAGLSYWEQQLNAGMSQEDVAAAIWQSAEHRTLEVENYYQTFLGRQGDAAGVQSWVNAFVAGMSEQQVEQAFLMAPEYQASHSDNATFVNGLYQDLLGREPDSAGSLAWILALQQGLSRTQVAQVFLTSDEFYTRTLNGYYADFLHRQADSVGLQTWLTQLAGGQVSLEQAGEAILGSEEFFAWARQLSTT
jgi:hypothetical protein